MIFSYYLFFSLFQNILSYTPIPPLTKGGRRDVHGWLILPHDQNKPKDPSSPLRAWFSHHVPEFWIDSPHNFQIILEGLLYPVASIENEYFGFNMPYPPIEDNLVFEYSFTPPSPFSLNDLLLGEIKVLNGVFYNGSFDTPYQRIPDTLARLEVLNLTTVTYLYEYETESFENLQYLSYPRGVTAPSNHYYLAHEIKAQPDYDHVVHGVFSECKVNGKSIEDLSKYVPTGASWKVPNRGNKLEDRLVAGEIVKTQYVPTTTSNNEQIECLFTVQEGIHCMIGPGFMENC
mmetsp:Transcript_7610/g.8057  ORF Transcript_7610/g.8057 Transcript_7610/m.8057 type:complete len:289 (+) Transcript_7610:63-929(+)